MYGYLCLLCEVVFSAVTDGAAEEAGLIVGDYVLAVNGTDVTSIPHSEAADLARQGMLFVIIPQSAMGLLLRVKAHVLALRE